MVFTVAKRCTDGIIEGSVLVLASMVRVEIEPGRREPGVAAATRRHESIHQAPEAASARSCFLDLAHEGLAALAFCSVDRPTGNGHPLAPRGIPTLLASEITSAEAWTTCR